MTTKPCSPPVAAEVLLMISQCGAQHQVAQGSAMLGLTIEPALVMLHSSGSNWERNM